MSEYRIVIGLLAAGALARLAWLFGNPANLKPIAGEGHNAAVALASGLGYADTFGPGSGLSAHVGMLTPLPSYAAYWAFGVDSPLAEAVLAFWCLALALAAIFLAWKIMAALGTPSWARIGAVLLLCLLPLQFGLEMRENRGWETPPATAAFLFIVLYAITAKADARHLTLARIGALTGSLFILNPPSGLAAVAVLAMVHIRDIPASKRWIAPAAFAVIALSLGSVWAARNVTAMGAPIALRSNLGLELAIANHPGAIGSRDRDAFVTRLLDIHPLYAKGKERRDAAGGEAAYSKMLMRDTGEWIKAHPGEFIDLSFKRLTQFFLPPQWHFAVYGKVGGGVIARQGVMWLVSLAALLTLAAMAWRRRAYLYILVAMLVCSAPYWFVQPTLRYRYLVFALMVAVAADGIARAFQITRNYARSLRRPRLAFGADTAIDR